MSDYPMLISNKLHSFRNFILQRYIFLRQRTTYASSMTNSARFNIRMSHTQYPTKPRQLLLSVIRLTSSMAVCSLFLFISFLLVNFTDM